MTQKNIVGDIVTILHGKNKGIQGRLCGYNRAKFYVWVHFLTPVKPFRRRRMRRSGRTLHSLQRVQLPSGDTVSTTYTESYSKKLSLRQDEFFNHSRIVREMTSQRKLLAILSVANRMRLYSRKILYHVFAFVPIAGIGHTEIFVPKLSMTTLSMFQTSMLAMLLKMKSANEARTIEQNLKTSRDIRKEAFNINVRHLESLNWAHVCCLGVPVAVKPDEYSMRIERTFLNLYVAARYMYDNVLMETIRILWENYRTAASIYSSDRVIMKKSRAIGTVNTVKRVIRNPRTQKSKFYTSNRILPQINKTYGIFSDLNVKARFLNDELSEIIDKGFVECRLDLTVRPSKGHFRMISLKSQQVENICSRIRVACVFGNENRARSELGEEEYLRLSKIAFDAVKENSDQHPMRPIPSKRCDRAFVFQNGRWEQVIGATATFL